MKQVLVLMRRHLMTLQDNRRNSSRRSWRSIAFVLRLCRDSDEESRRVGQNETVDDLMTDSSSEELVYV